MPDGSVVIKVDADNADAYKKLKELEKEYEKTEKSINSTGEKRNGIVESLEQAREAASETAREIQEIRAQMAENESVLSGRTGDVDLEEYNARKQAQEEATLELSQQEKLYEKQVATVAKLEGQEASLTSQLESQTAKLENIKTEAGEVERTLAMESGKTMPNISAAIGEVNANLKKGFKNILKWGFGIRSVFILVRRLRSAIKEGIQDYAKSDPETQANIDALKTSLNGLKASIGAAFAPILTAAIPILQKLIGWLQTAIEYVSMFFSALSGGKTYKKAIANNTALAKSYGSAGGAAKDAKKQIMGFDEINKLNADESGGGGGGGGSMPLADYADEDIPDKFTEIIDFIKENIYELETIIGDALLAIGAILLFTWTSPVLGLGMIVAGLAMKYNVAMNWDALPENMRKTITLIDVLLGVALLAIGAILTFSSPAHLALGIGLMAAGAVMLGSAAALNWDTISGFIQENITTILVVLGAALLVVGAILAFASPAHIALGIGLMAAGAIALGSAVAINWDAIAGFISNNISDILLVLGAALLVIGAILTFACPALMPLGIGLMVAGGLSLFAGGMLSIDWDSIPNKLQSVKTKISTKLEGIKSDFKAGLDKVKEWWDGLSFPEFHIPAPHFEWTYTQAEGLIAKALEFVGLPATIPHLHISWYARGGIVDGPTLLGAGEAGKEAVVPLERNTEWIDMVARGIIDRLTKSHEFTDAITDAMLPAIVRGQVVPPRALSGGGSMFTDGDIQKLVNGIAEALSNDSEGQTIKLYLDGRQIAETVTRHQRQMARGLA